MIRIDLIKVTSRNDIYLGFKEMDSIPIKNSIIFYLHHEYKVIDIRNHTAFVKLINNNYDR